MNSTTAYQSLLTRAATALVADRDPDGLATRQALLLVAHAGLHRASDAASADWDLFAATMTQAIIDIQADIPDPAVLARRVPSPDPDDGELRRAVVELVHLLADRYAAAASGPAGSPWRRLVWARAAHQLDDAVAELT